MTLYLTLHAIIPLRFPLSHILLPTPSIPTPNHNTVTHPCPLYTLSANRHTRMHTRARAHAHALNCTTHTHSHFAYAHTYVDIAQKYTTRTQ